MKESQLTTHPWELVTNEAARNCPAPAVSVIITLYNYSAYITGCLDSVRASKTDGLPGGFEVVILDDASTDDSAAVAEKYLAASPLPITLVKKLDNTGVSDTRNIGLVLARAPFVFSLDADNEIRPDCLVKHYQALASSDHALAYGLIQRFESDTRKLLTVMANFEWNVRELVDGQRMDAMCMLRKDAALRVGGYSIEYGIIGPQGWEDYDLFLKLAQAGGTGKFIPEILSDYRVHTRSMIHAAIPYHREKSAYFSRKFFTLAYAHDGTANLFNSPRGELAGIHAKRLGKPPPPRRTGFFHGLLGHKMRRSLSKRLSTVYEWLNLPE